MIDPTKFLKTNWFRVLVILLLGILALHFYQSSRQTAALELQEKCRQAGDRAYQLDKERYGDSLMEPQFAYNPRLEKCLYSGGYNDSYSVCSEYRLGEKCMRGQWERWVKDAYTNEQIIMTWNAFDASGNGMVTQVKDIEDYWNEHEVLMNEY